MITNTIISQKDAREAILSGVKKVADAVTSTLGPGGRNVIIERIGMQPNVTKDGVSVARSITLKDNFENMGAQMVIEVASKTNSSCGDGTTTATLLAYEMYKEAVKAVNDGEEPMNVKRGMLAALKEAIGEIDRNVVEIKDEGAVENVAKISANGDTKIAEMVANIIRETGADGIISVQESNSLDTTYSTTKGVRLDSGLKTTSLMFANDEKGGLKTTFENCKILLHEKKLGNANELFPILQQCVKNQFPLVIVAPDFDADVISTLVVNRLRTGLKVAAVKAPGVLEAFQRAYMTDVAVATGGTMVSDALGLKLENAQLSDLGTAKKVEITPDNITFIDGEADKAKFDAHVESLRSEMNSEGTNESMRHVIKERIAKLIAGIGVVRVGGETRSIIHEKRDRIDDAICATREAISGGIVAGGGVTLYKVGLSLLANGGEDVGRRIVGTALTTPLKKIFDNAGYLNTEEAKAIMRDYELCGVDGMPQNAGYDVSNWKFHNNLIDAGVIDPANVTKSAVTNAISVAALLISTDCMVGIDASSVPQIDPNMLNG